MYGHQWASQQGAEPNDTWVRGLDGITNDQLGVGLRSLLLREDKWPPNLPEFRQLCLNSDGDKWERQAHRIYEPERRLEDLTSKERRVETGKVEISKILDGLKL